ncbi:hypothetical protein [Caulobacter endophyticus]|uniref:hypothetical protein n=1 Tax=Caulobacter endophyticus TaxID=2172652 RepID=UPI00240EF748|nr:hypothetical protein [Caulobacter endophyticus]MDG2530753.1 hypothetical protein [Caulobacter endophyticus]
MTTSATQQPSLGKPPPALGVRCLRLLEAVVWSALALVLLNWTSPAAPFCLFVIGVATAAPIGRPWIDEAPRAVTTGASCVLLVGLVSDGLTASESWNRILVVLALVLAVAKAGGFSFRARPRWAWIIVAFAAAVALFALDHQRILAPGETLAVARGDAPATLVDPIAYLRAADRSWWVAPVLLALLLTVGRVVAWYGLALIRRRQTDLPSERGT